jgi:hypothetical protein
MGACQFVSVRIATVSIAEELFGTGLSSGTYVVSEAGSSVTLVQDDGTYDVTKMVRVARRFCCDG